MNERLLQHVWQYQHFNNKQLTTTRGERLEILSIGNFNRNQGPDFLHAKIKIGNRIWVGNVELHIDASDWYRHSHDEDANYNNVILHVVWNDDAEIVVNAQPVPVLVLDSRVPRLLLEQYGKLLLKEQFIPCEKCLREIDEIKWRSWKERLLIERLSRKAAHIKCLLDKNRRHWDETLWWILARNFGLMINADAFEEMAMSLPLKTMLRHKDEIEHLEAMLFGQAGLLYADHVEDYPRRLYEEYLFLKEKYSFSEVHQRVQFLRMRPAAFPTVRLALLSMILHRSYKLFSGLTEVVCLDTIKKELDVTASEYWNTHFLFDEKSAFRNKRPGAQLLQSVMVNTIVPYVYAYGECRGEEKYINRALGWLREMPAEKNMIIKEFAHLDVVADDAADSQALLELKSRYCDQRRCLECALGAALLGRSAAG